MQEHYKSNTSHDEITIILIKKAHKGIFKIKSVDVSTNHIDLVTLIIDTLKKDDIKWIEITMNFEPTTPPNTISYVNKYNNNIICHIEDFNNFYLANILKLITVDHIYYVPTKVSNDGWIKVSNHKVEKKEKYDKIIQEFQILVGDWNNDFFI